MLKKNESYNQIIDTKIKISDGNRNVEEIKQKYRRQAAFSQAKWVTHIALRTGHFWVSCFSVNITHCWILRWSGVSGWSSGSISDSTSLINVVLTPKPPSSTVWKHIFCFFFVFVFFQCGINIQIRRKSRKKAHAIEWNTRNKPFNKRYVRMRSKYMIVCMLSCNGTDVWVWENGPGVSTVSGC